MRPLIPVTYFCKRPLIQADVRAVVFMNELKNLTNVVTGKLGKLIHKQNTTFFYFIAFCIIIVQVMIIHYYFPAFVHR
jgi:hypothetical protein